jgi:hypothetical protein
VDGIELSWWVLPDSVLLQPARTQKQVATTEDLNIWAPLSGAVPIQEQTAQAIHNS